jgi:hypothetical protein
MSKYRVTSDQCELPKGSVVYIVPGEVQPGQLAMFELRGDPEFLLTGRWFPNVAGHNWIVQPGRLVCDTGSIQIRILGAVIPLEAPPKEICDLSTSEYVNALFDDRRLKG